MTDCTKKFTLYINEFNHTHRFSKEFLDKIFDYTEKIYSGNIVMGNHPPANTVVHAITYITNRLTSPLYINIPLLGFLAKTSQTSPILYNSIRVFIVEECINKHQLFIDKELLHNQLTRTHLFGLNEVIYNVLVYSKSSGMVEYICNQLLQTDIGKQNIIDLYNSISKNSDITANAIFPYAQKALATDNVTADDIKDLFDI